MGIPDIKKVKEQQNTKLHLMKSRLHRIEERLKKQEIIADSSLPPQDNIQPQVENSQMVFSNLNLSCRQQNRPFLKLLIQMQW
jgi:hypothetical protein